MVPGQTGAVYHFTAVSALDAGSYQARVSNGLGEATSAAAQLIVVGAPAITTQPASTSVAAGGTASFSVVATGDALRYQWLRDGEPIEGATGESYRVSSADAGTALSVQVTVSAEGFDPAVLVSDERDVKDERPGKPIRDLIDGIVGWLAGLIGWLFR